MEGADSINLTSCSMGNLDLGRGSEDRRSEILGRSAGTIILVPNGRVESVWLAGGRSSEWNNEWDPDQMTL